MKKWTFVPCVSPSNARLRLAQRIQYYNDTKYRLTVKGNCYGFEYK